MEIDHVFFLAKPDGAAAARLESLGLVETYRRAHPGQGTQNACFCFDNMFLECLWVNDVAALCSPAIARTRLFERSQWIATGACPFGIAWRGAAETAFDPPTWPFRPPYLPAGMTIEVCVDSDDPRQPMLFRSPGGEPPVQWAPARRVALQHAAGLGRIVALTLELPRGVAASPALDALARCTCLVVREAGGDRPGIICEVERLDGSGALAFRLPGFLADA